MKKEYESLKIKRFGQTLSEMEQSFPKPSLSTTANKFGPSQPAGVYNLIRFISTTH